MQGLSSPTRPSAMAAVPRSKRQKVEKRAEKDVEGTVQNEQGAKRPGVHQRPDPAWRCDHDRRQEKVISHFISSIHQNTTKHLFPYHSADRIPWAVLRPSATRTGDCVLRDFDTTTAHHRRIIGTSCAIGALSSAPHAKYFIAYHKISRCTVACSYVERRHAPEVDGWLRRFSSPRSGAICSV